MVYSPNTYTDEKQLIQENARISKLQKIPSEHNLFIKTACTERKSSRSSPAEVRKHIRKCKKQVQYQNFYKKYKEGDRNPSQRKGNPQHQYPADPGK